ncbi:MAG: M20/M25/M40 family metallo-hydrolase [Acidobacteria bacterium]|nr:M20/M25/M40 family metallo-hydrolase [Acidobacteriota bacterium]
MHLLTRTLFLLFIAATLPAADPDWDELNGETLRHFQALVRMDTSDPPGREQPAADYLKSVLEAEGIPVQTFTLDDGRPNLVARLRGNGSKRPLLIMSHTDVVNVEPSKWPTLGPFSAGREGGYIYGRGTIDDKDNLTASLMTMLVLKRAGVELDRDVIFLAESGEEGNIRVGIAYMVAEHYPEIEAEYCLAEGGGVVRRAGKIVSMNVATAEKVPARAKLITQGTAGHGSVPLDNNAIARISQAVAAAAAWQTPMKLNDTTRYYFERLAAISEPDAAARYNGLSHPDRSAAVQEYLRLNEPAHYSMLRTSISPTIIQAGYRMNVIPADAEATLDIRAVPDENIEEFFAELQRRIGEGVKIEQYPMSRRPVAPSRVDTVAFEVLEELQKELYPGAVTLPAMLNGATDMALLRERGVQCYGIGPLGDDEDRAKGFGAHSDQERILEAELYRFTRFHYEAAKRIATR